MLWKNASASQIKAWIRQAALDFFETGDTDCSDWQAERRQDGWSQAEIDEFLEKYSDRIQAEHDFLDDWSVAKR
jgi:hypothetical protein